jgi:hypothetical protein
MTQREAVHKLDGGRCVACGKKHRVRASSWHWQAHHVIKRQALERRGVKPARIRDATFCVLVCRIPCHENQTSHHARIPLERLPARVVRAVDELGPWAQDALRRMHPPGGGWPEKENAPADHEGRRGR